MLREMIVAIDNESLFSCNVNICNSNNPSPHNFYLHKLENG